MKYADIDTSQTIVIRQNHMELTFDCTASRTFDGSGAWEIKTQDRTFRVNPGRRCSPWKKAEQELRQLVGADAVANRALKPLVESSCRVLGK
jgi:hypothetical protein